MSERINLRGWINPCILRYRTVFIIHDDVMKWKHFPRYLPFVRGIHRPAVNSPHNGQWRGALMFSLICVWINGWVNNLEAGDLRRNRAHYDVIVMFFSVAMFFDCAGRFVVLLNALGPRQNGCHFADDFFKCIFLNGNVWISLKFVPNVRINNIALAQIMAWRQATSHYLNQWWLNYRRIYSSFGFNETTVVRFHGETLFFIWHLTAPSHYLDQCCVITRSRGVHLRAMAKGHFISTYWWISCKMQWIQLCPALFCYGCIIDLSGFLWYSCQSHSGLFHWWYDCSSGSEANLKDTCKIDHCQTSTT